MVSSDWNICRTLLMVSVAYGQGRILGGRMRVMHPPTGHFQKFFWCKVYTIFPQFRTSSIAISLTIATSLVMRRHRLGDLALGLFGCRIGLMIFRAIPRRRCFLFLGLIAKFFLLLLAYLSSYHENATKCCMSSLRSCRPSVYHTNMGEFR